MYDQHLEWNNNAFGRRIAAEMQKKIDFRNKHPKITDEVLDIAINELTGYGIKNGLSDRLKSLFLTRRGEALSDKIPDGMKLTSVPLIIKGVEYTGWLLSIENPNAIKSLDWNTIDDIKAQSIWNKLSPEDYASRRIVKEAFNLDISAEIEEEKRIKKAEQEAIADYNREMERINAEARARMDEESGGWLGGALQVVCTVVGGALGFATAPFTGGLSLAAATALGASIGSGIGSIFD